jgi:hypothetical protein
MVIGQVVEGLDVARAISMRPLAGEGTRQSKEYRPLNPVVIRRVVLDRGSTATDSVVGNGP